MVSDAVPPSRGHSRSTAPAELVRCGIPCSGRPSDSRPGCPRARLANDLCHSLSWSAIAVLVAAAPRRSWATGPPGWDSGSASKMPTASSTASRAIGASQRHPCRTHANPHSAIGRVGQLCGRARPAPSPTPTRRTTPDSDHQTAPPPATSYATTTPKVPSDPCDTRGLNRPHYRRSEGAFLVQHAAQNRSLIGGFRLRSSAVMGDQAACRTE